MKLLFKTDDERREELEDMLRASEAGLAHLNRQCDEYLSQLRASEAECARLRREVEDVRKLDERRVQVGPVSVFDEHGNESVCWAHPFDVCLFGSSTAARRAAVEYLEKERKDG